MRRVLATLLPILLFLLTIGIAFFVALREDTLFGSDDAVARSVALTMQASDTDDDDEPVNVAATLVAEANPEQTEAAETDDDLLALDGTAVTPDADVMTDEATVDDAAEPAEATVTATSAAEMDETETESDAEPTTTPTDEAVEMNAEAEATATQMASAAMTPMPTVEPCRPRSDWHPYMVEIGENLFRIGLRYNLTVMQMQRANCLPTTRIDAGQIIFVPEKELPPTPTPLPVAPAENELPQLGFGAPSYRLTEDAGSLTVYLQTTAPVTEAVSVEIGAVEGGAMNGQDFMFTAQTVTIAANQSEASVTIRVPDDSTVEEDEVFYLYLANAVNAIVPDTESTITITIQDNDTAPAAEEPAPTATVAAGEPTVAPAPTATTAPDGPATVGFEFATYTVDEAVGQTLLAIRLSHPIDMPVTSLVTISNISTVYGEDMTFDIGNYVIPAGETVIYVQVSIIDDAVAEDVEQFNIYLFEPSNATLSPTSGTATVSINDND